MKRMTLRTFGTIVSRILETLPHELKQYLSNVVVDVEDEPDEEFLRRAGFTEEEIEAGESLYGYFEPMNLIVDTYGDALDMPHRIRIFKRPLEEDFQDLKKLRIEIRKTVIHELAHHFGYTDRDLERFDAQDDPFGDDFDPENPG